jgi:hypothetical protein
MKKHIVINPFREIEGSGTKKFIKGQDVSHFSDAKKKDLQKKKLIEEVEIPDENESQDEKIKAKDLIEKINEAETIEGVDALISDEETRITVLEAAENRKKELDNDQ